MKLKQKKLTVCILAVCCCLLVVALIIGISKSGTGKETAAAETTAGTEAAQAQAAAQMPWEADGAKRPEDYTMEDFESLTPEQQKVFLETIGKQGYEVWLKEMNIDEETLPWKQSGAKQPQSYSWAEYQALGENEKKAFMATLGPYKLEQWLQSVGMVGTSGSATGSSGSSDSSDSSSSEQDKIYTWTEYQALSFDEKKAFIDRLGIAGFNEWLKNNQGQKVNGSNYHQNPWEQDGAKQPKDYTLEEYEDLTPEEQTAFQIHLGTKAFKAWQEKAKLALYPWGQPGAKQPKDYTWEEYESLTQKQKTAFQEHLGVTEFIAWKDQFFQLPEYPWEKDGAKTPMEYTWKEYENLTQDEQYAFQEYLQDAGMKTWLKNQTNIPWEAAGSTQPSAYTLEEYKKLTKQQQLAFQVYMGAVEFELWYEEAQAVKEVYPWEKPGAKQPKDYTLAEYNALTQAQQIAFQKYLGAAGFEAWQNKPEPNPWEQSNAKQPQDYTMAEFAALTEAQQMAFQKSLGEEGFAAWQNKNQSKPTANPWEVSGAKQPKDYSMAEFAALTEAQQVAFQKHLGDKAFDEWLQKQQSQSEANPWDGPGSKQPKDYTKAEYDALTVSQQMAFQKHLGEQAFDEWLKKNQQTQPAEVYPWEQPGAKQPADYSMGEFEALTASQQIAFQKHLGEQAFDEWLKKNQQTQPAEVYPWEQPGAKQPADYSMGEFEALTASQQIAFQKHLGSAGFEAWLNSVLEQNTEASGIDLSEESTEGPAEEPTEEPTEVPTEVLE